MSSPAKTHRLQAVSYTHLDVYKRQVETCPQIELACGDKVTALVLRHLEPLSQADLGKLREFAGQHSGVPVSYTHLDVYKRQR